MQRMQLAIQPAPDRAFATLAGAMRPVLIAVLLLAASAVLAATSGADTPARARAQASIVTGGLGDFGSLSARGDAEETDDDVAVQAQGISVGTARSSPAPRAPAAPAAPAPRRSPARSTCSTGS